MWAAEGRREKGSCPQVEGAASVTRFLPCRKPHPISIWTSAHAFLYLPRILPPVLDLISAYNLSQRRDTIRRQEMPIKLMGYIISDSLAVAMIVINFAWQPAVLIMKSGSFFDLLRSTVFVEISNIKYRRRSSQDTGAPVLAVSRRLP